MELDPRIDKYKHCRYKVKIGEEPAKLATMIQAGIAWDFGWAPVSIDDQVLDTETGEFRRITEEENYLIQDIADEYSANK